MSAPDVVVSSSLRQWQEALQFANEVGEELARRVDWGQLQAQAPLIGDGTNKIHALPALLSRLNRGISVMAGTSIVRPLTRAEWSRLPAIEGTPRYYLLEGRAVTLWPYLGTGATAVLQYQSSAWCSNGLAEFTSDMDASLIDEVLFVKALVVRWRRQKGMPYADEEAEYEAALSDMAGFNDRSRI
jgi:hypothetical protein